MADQWNFGVAAAADDDDDDTSTIAVGRTNGRANCSSFEFVAEIHSAPGPANDLEAAAVAETIYDRT